MAARHPSSPQSGSKEPQAASHGAAALRPRPAWKGFLRLSLVSISVELYGATAGGDHLALHQIHRPSGKRVRYEKVVPGLGPIKSEDIVKGFEIDDDTYVVLEPEELEGVKLETKRTIDLVQFFDMTDADLRFFEKPFYLMPEGHVSTEGFLVINAALSAARKMGIGQMTMRGREYLVAVAPFGRGLLLEQLRYSDEVRPADQLFSSLPDAKLDKEMIGLAAELIERKSRGFDVASFTDHYASALEELVERKRKGRAIVTAEERPERREPGNVVDLMDALRKSVGQVGSEKAAPQGTRRPRRPPRGRSDRAESRRRRA